MVSPINRIADAFSQLDYDSETVSPTVRVDILISITNHVFDKTLTINIAYSGFYDPAQHRFLSPDPHWNPISRIYGDNPVQMPNAGLLPNFDAILQSNNKYVYVGNNPLRYVDLTGFVLVDLEEYAKTYNATVVERDGMYQVRWQDPEMSPLVYSPLWGNSWKRTRYLNLFENQITIVDGRAVVDDKLFVDAFGIGTDSIVVYECPTTGNVSIRGAFRFNPCEEMSREDARRYQELFLRGIEYWWTVEFDEYNVSAYARQSFNGINVNINNRSGTSTVTHPGVLQQSWRRTNPGSVTMYTGGPFAGYDETDFMWTSAHEFGHILGLTGSGGMLHGGNFGNAIMRIRNTHPDENVIESVVIAYNTNRRVLHNDDGTRR